MEQATLQVFQILSFFLFPPNSRMHKLIRKLDGCQVSPELPEVRIEKVKSANQQILPQEQEEGGMKDEF